MSGRLYPVFTFEGLETMFFHHFQD